MSRWLNRKDLAQILDVSVDQVRKNEKAWGLDAARYDLNLRVVRYDKERAELIIKERGLRIQVPPVQTHRT